MGERKCSKWRKQKPSLESKHNGLENLIYFQFLLPAAVSLPKAVKWFYSDASYVFAIVRTTVNMGAPIISLFHSQSTGKKFITRKY